MDQKINTTISADNKQFISAIQQATQVADAMIDKLNDIGDNASDAASRIDDAADSIKQATDAISQAGDAAESTKPSWEGLAQGIAKAGNLGQVLSNITGELLKGTTLTATEIGIVAKGVESLFQIAMKGVKQYIQTQKDFAETLDRNAHSLSEVADANVNPACGGCLRADFGQGFVEVAQCLGGAVRSGGQDICDVVHVGRLKAEYAHGVCSDVRRLSQVRACGKREVDDAIEGTAYFVRGKSRTGKGGHRRSGLACCECG